tara:strand:+ start:12551 stop:13090 length:540 start_codon:yes stop_codon:yes gene_type:complete
MKTYDLKGDLTTTKEWQILQSQGGIIRLTLSWHTTDPGMVLTRYVGIPLDGNNGLPYIFQVVAIRNNLVLYTQQHHEIHMALADHKHQVEQCFNDKHCTDVVDHSGGQSLQKYWTKPCPICGSRLTLRKGKYGLFYGCEKYPDCIGSANIRGDFTGKTLVAATAAKSNTSRRIKNATLE